MAFSSDDFYTATLEWMKDCAEGRGEADELFLYRHRALTALGITHTNSDMLYDWKLQDALMHELEVFAITYGNKEQGDTRLFQALVSIFTTSGKPRIEIGFPAVSRITEAIKPLLYTFGGRELWEWVQEALYTYVADVQLQEVTEEKKILKRDYESAKRRITKLEEEVASFQQTAREKKSADSTTAYNSAQVVAPLGSGILLGQGVLWTGETQKAEQVLAQLRQQGELLHQEQEENERLTNDVRRLQSENADLRRTERELETSLAATEQNLEIAEIITEELRAERDLLRPPETEQITAAYHASLKELSEAVKQQPGQGGLCEREYWLTETTLLIYSFAPSEVELARKLLLQYIDQVKEGGKRVLPADVLPGFARVLGYPNLFDYLSREQQPFLDMLCNLAFSPNFIKKHFSFDAAARSWLQKTMLPPSASPIPLQPCCIVSEEGQETEISDSLARAVIAFEKHRLLDFRTSLWLTLSAVAPLSDEEITQQEQAVFLESQKPQFQVVSETCLKDKVYIVAYKYYHPSLRLWVESALTFNSEGQLLNDEDVDEELGND